MMPTAFLSLEALKILMTFSPSATTDCSIRIKVVSMPHDLIGGSNVVFAVRLVHTGILGTLILNRWAQITHHEILGFLVYDFALSTFPFSLKPYCNIRFFVMSIHLMRTRYSSFIWIELPASQGNECTYFWFLSAGFFVLLIMSSTSNIDSVVHNAA